METDEYYSVLGNADIFVLPSHREGFGLAALEALYYKKILVVTRGQFQDFLDDSNAILVAPKNSQSLFEGLKRAIDLQPSVVQALAQRAHNTSLDFLPERIASKLVIIYEHLLKKR